MIQKFGCTIKVISQALGAKLVQLLQVYHSRTAYALYSYLHTLSLSGLS